MQKRLLFLVSTLVLVSNVLFAQNCPANPTYKNTSGTYDLSAKGSSYAVNDGKTYNVTVQNGYSSTSTICVTNGSTLNLSFSTLNVLATGGSIYVDATSKLNIKGGALTNFPFTLTNYGTVIQSTDVNFGEGASLNNYGIYSASSNIIVNGVTVAFNNSGTMTFSGSTNFNSNSFSITNAQNSSLTFTKDAVFNFAKITNKGTLNFNATATFNSVSLLYNSNTLNFTGALIINVGTITNYGLITAQAGININTGVSMSNYCTIVDNKDFTFNAGNFNNYGNLLLKTTGSSSFVTQGNFVNGPNGFVQGYNFTSNGPISGGGNFYFQNSTMKNGSFGGSASSYINFYDATPTAGKYFDIQNSTPPYTTKNAISPITTTSFIACGEPATPAITTQPADVTFCNNSTTTATFSVVAYSPYSSMTYQWKKNGVNISGATSSSYTVSGLTLADTANVYTVAVTNNMGTTVSNGATVNYIIVAQPTPASLYLATGSAAAFTIKTSGATAWQWQKDGKNVPGATTNIYNNAAVKLTDAGSYTNTVTYSGGTCTSNASVLTVENPPSITTQPQLQVLCNNSITSATYNVIAAASVSALSYQWYKNGTIISGATSGSFTANGLTYNDTANTYYVVLKNGVASVTSNSVGLKYLIVAQPAPASSYLATGNAVIFTATASSIASAIQWKKDGANIPGATSLSYKINPVVTTSAGNYTLAVTYNGATCTSNAAVLTPSIVLYSKATGNMNMAATWGVNTDGSGSTPVDFTRDEHTFIVANRTSILTGGNLTIAGKLDVGNGNIIITPGSTLTAGRIVRSLSTGAITGSSTSSLAVNGITTAAYAGSSDLYFNSTANTLQNLTIAGHTVTLRTALNITAGSTPGQLQVSSGIFNTSDLLTLKSDASGTAMVASSVGTISGKVTVERFIPARRAWRLMCAPIEATGAPTINAAWQEGATSSASNPHPGYGTHITYGLESDGFDQNPQKTFSMYYYNNANVWTGIPATNKTLITSYPGYLFFVRGNRSYDILHTTSSVPALTTVLRTIGSLNQAKQPDINVSPSGFTLIGNPYASPVDFEKIYNLSSKILHTIRVWDPELAGTKGVGAYVTLDWNGNGYTPTPPSNMTNIIQQSQAFFVQSTSKGAGKVSLDESVKNITTTTNPFGRMMARQTADTTLEINLKVFNDDGTTGITDGILYYFNNRYNNDITDRDVVKFNNLYENLSIYSHSTLLTVERRQTPLLADTLQLYLTGTKSTDYQLEFVPVRFKNVMYLYDRYLNSLTPLSATDTTRVSISINTADAASKDASRFSITGNQQVLPVSFLTAKAYPKAQTVQVEWTVADEIKLQGYEVEKSSNGSVFTKAGELKATGALSYSFNDATPYSGASYYRIKSIDKSGKVIYSAILPVTLNNTAVAGNLSIYPNPINGKQFQVQISNKAAGTYTLAVVSSGGQQLYTQTISYNGGMATYSVVLNKSLAAGVYFLKAIEEADGSTTVIKAIVE